MRDAVIVSALRTPVGLGKPGKGALSGIHPVDLSATVIAELVASSGVVPEAIDDVIWGCVSQIGEQSTNIGRNAALAAGLPEAVPHDTVAVTGHRERREGEAPAALHHRRGAVDLEQDFAEVAELGDFRVVEVLNFLHRNRSET